MTIHTNPPRRTVARRVLAGGVLAVLVPVLAGCGGGTSDSGGAGTEHADSRPSATSSASQDSWAPKPKVTQSQLPPTSGVSGKQILIKGDALKQVITCQQNPVRITGGSSTLEFRGTCGKVSIEAPDNNVKIENASSVDVASDTDWVVVARTDSITIAAGSIGNMVKCSKNLAGSGEPKVSNPDESTNQVLCG